MKKHLIKLLLSFTFGIGFVVSGLLNQKLEAATPTFAEQFPNAHTAQVVAAKFSKQPTDEMDVSSLGTTYLDLSYQSLTDVTGIEIFSDLHSLSLHHNQLVSLPEGLGQLKNLEFLYLNSNLLVSLPESIGSLTKLFDINLYNNKLLALPNSFGSLSSLDGLNLSVNRLTSLPDSFVNLSTLTTLYIENNQLTNFPIGMDNLINLDLVYAEGNLLPQNFGTILNNEGFPLNPFYDEFQDQLEVIGTPVLTIRNQEDLNTIDFLSILKLASNAPLSTTHNFKFINFLDENMQSVNLDDYLSNGIVHKSGKLYAQGSVVQNEILTVYNSHGITSELIELNFEATYYELSFNLNGGEGILPESQSLIEGTVGMVVTDPNREGFTFKGWNTLQDGSGATWMPGTTPMIGSDVILYAQWEENSKPVPPIPLAPEPDKNDTGTVSTNGLPQTGGYGPLLISLVSLGTGLLTSSIGFRKK